MTVLTLPSLVLAALALRRASWWPMCLAVAGVAPAGVSLVAAGFGVPVFYFVGLFAAAAVALRLMAVTTSLPVRIAGVPGARLLLAFGIWAAVVTVTAPALFPGMPVLGSGQGNLTMLVPGAVTSSNVAQLAYLWIAIAGILVLASAQRAHPYLVGVPAVGIVALSFARYVADHAGLPFPAGLFDNNPALVYIETAPGGVERFRGILSEPASLATYCLAAAAFAVAMLPRVAAAAKVGLSGVLVISIVLGIASTSTTFVVAGCLLCAVGALSFAWPLIQRKRRIAPAHVVVLLVLLVVAYVAGPTLIQYVGDAVTAKSGAGVLQRALRSGLVLDPGGGAVPGARSGPGRQPAVVVRGHAAQQRRRGGAAALRRRRVVGRAARAPLRRRGADDLGPGGDPRRQARLRSRPGRPQRPAVRLPRRARRPAGRAPRTPPTPAPDRRFEPRTGGCPMSDLLPRIRRCWWILMSGVALGLAGAAALTATSQPLYVSTAKVYVSIRTQPDSTSLNQGSQFAQQQIASYAQIATSPLVLQPVIARLNLPATTSDLAGQVSATAPEADVADRAERQGRRQPGDGADRQRGGRRAHQVGRHAGAARDVDGVPDPRDHRPARGRTDEGDLTQARLQRRARAAARAAARRPRQPRPGVGREPGAEPSGRSATSSASASSAR